MNEVESYESRVASNEAVKESSKVRQNTTTRGGLSGLDDPAELVDLVAPDASSMLGGVALTADCPEVLEVQSDLRIGDCHRVDLDNVMDYLGGLVDSFGEAVFAEAARLLEVCRPALLPSF